MNFKVPQNVQREDTIVGPLTMKQLVIVGVGGGLAYAAYAILAKDYTWQVWLPPVALLGGATAAFAFAKIHGMTFYKYFVFFLEFVLLPKKRVWMRGSGDAREALFQKEEKKSEKIQIAPQKSVKNLAEVIKILDSKSTSQTRTKQSDPVCPA